MRVTSASSASSDATAKAPTKSYSFVEDLDMQRHRVGDAAGYAPTRPRPRRNSPMARALQSSTPIEQAPRSHWAE